MVAQRYARDLEEAQDDARDAIEDAREAQRRIDRAQAQLADARDAGAAAALRLEAVSPLLGTWYLRGGSRAAALREPVSRDAGTLERLLERGRNRRDFGGEVIEELGYSISMWNGKEEQAASLSVTCGGFSGRVGNVALVKASLAGDGRVGLDPEGFAVEGLRSLVEVWQPDWVTV